MSTTFPPQSVADASSGRQPDGLPGLTVLAPSRFDRILATLLTAAGVVLAGWLAYGAFAIPPPLRTPETTALATGCCPWDGEAHAWIDGNEDGVFQPWEAPLGGVSIRAVGFFDVRELTTDAGGVAAFHLPGRCGGNEERRVEAEPPSGYRLTAVSGSGPGGSYAFGFAPTAR